MVKINNLCQKYKSQIETIHVNFVRINRIQNIVRRSFNKISDKNEIENLYHTLYSITDTYMNTENLLRKTDILVKSILPQLTLLLVEMNISYMAKSIEGCVFSEKPLQLFNRLYVYRRVFQEIQNYTKNKENTILESSLNEKIHSSIDAVKA